MRRDHKDMRGRGHVRIETGSVGAEHRHGVGSGRIGYGGPPSVEVAWISYSLLPAYLDGQHELSNGGLDYSTLQDGPHPQNYHTTPGQNLAL